MKNNKLVVIDLFCGAGGFSTGFSMADYKVAIGVDFDKYAGKTFSYNHKDSVFIEKDINSLSTKELLDTTNLIKEQIDCVIGGPPCQGFSTAGKRMIDDPRNRLYKNFVRIVSDIKPKVFVMENVKGLVSMQNGEVIKQVVEDFEVLGFKVKYKILDSSNYGVPQKRKRVIIIGIRNDLNIEPTFPKEIFNKDNYTTISDAIGDLPQTIVTENTYISEPKTRYQALMRGYITAEDFFNKDCKFKPVTDCELKDHDIKYFSEEKIQKMIAHKRRHETKNTGFGMRFFDYKKVGYTLTSHFQTNYEMLHPDTEHPRFFTIREGARIQGYPDCYVFVGGKTNQAKQIGNSVPVLLAYCIAEHIKNNIFKVKEKIKEEECNE